MKDDAKYAHSEALLHKLIGKIIEELVKDQPVVECRYAHVN